MSGARMIAVAAVLLVAVGTAAPTASAAETLWKWLPGAEKTALVVETGALKIETVNKETLTCEKTTTTAGEIVKESTLATASLKMGTNCKVNLFKVENEGSGEPGLISFPVELHNCLIAAGDAGILVKLAKEVKLEITATKEKVALRGAFIILASPNKTKMKAFGLLIQQENGKQKIEKCEGGVAHTLELAKPEEFVAAGVEATGGEIRFTAIEQEIMV